MPSNLPPGVSESMIPCNRPEDIAWEKTIEDIQNSADEHGLCANDALTAWKMGVAALLVVKERLVDESADIDLDSEPLVT